MSRFSPDKGKNILYCCPFHHSRNLKNNLQLLTNLLILLLIITVIHPCSDVSLFCILLQSFVGCKNSMHSFCFDLAVCDRFDLKYLKDLQFLWVWFWLPYKLSGRKQWDKKLASRMWGLKELHQGFHFWDNNNG